MTFVNTVPSYCGREMGYFLVGHQACVDCHSALAGMRSSADWKTFAVKSARIPGARKGRSDRSTSDQRLPVLQHNGGNKRLSDPPDATEDDSDFAEAPARGGEEIEMRCGQPRPEARNWTVIRKLDTCQRNPYHSGQHRSRDREWEQGRLTSHLRIRRAAGKGRK